MEEMDTLRIVLLGKTGSGKSSLGNTIFGDRQDFMVSSCASSKAIYCQSVIRRVNGRNVLLIDTPGLFDTHLQHTELSPDILKCIEQCAPGPHAFLIVLKVERYTPQEQAVVDMILKYFSEEVLKYTTLVFTHGDDLPEGMTVKDWASKNTALKTLIRKCGGRCHVFDNKYWNNSQDPYRNNQYQVKELLQTIDQTVKENSGTCYTNDRLQQAQKQQKPQSLFSWLFGF